ncbi:MAG: thiamine biosynthesis protein ThiJ [Rhizobiales bacterium PAR1]|nr:MAG: thiamine biosynthesis protein ThiJ [Rhizobiales bacterium PAR1]
MTRRRLGEGLASLALAVAAGGIAPLPAAAQSSTPEAGQQPTGHDMSVTPPHWIGKEQIAFLIYPDFTALDMIGPHYMLTNLMGAKTHIVAKTKDPVKSDTGLVFVPSASFEDCPADLDILCVPGGTLGTLTAIRDEATIRFLKDRGSRAKFVTSVCTGSLVLAAAGLLDGYKATSHWLTKALLSKFGAIPTEGRVVRDRNRITGGGVTAGLDFGLGLVGELRDRNYAEGVQLLAEYDPQPPFNAGSPEKAPPEVKSMMDAMFVEFLKTAEATVLAARTAKP